MTKARSAATNGWIVAIAIEDSVDLKAVPYADDRASQSASEPFFFTKQIGSESGYLNGVLELVARGFRDLVASCFENGRDFAQSTKSVVISTPGVVDDNSCLLQLPLWNAPTSDALPWTRLDSRGRPRVEQIFDFRNEITAVVTALLAQRNEKWSPDERRHFQNSIFVVNDATACAALEYDARKDQSNPEDFVLLKVHNGINVGFIQRNKAGQLAVKTSHAESGHGYPRVHASDAEIGFVGVCIHHHACFEGMVASHSLFQRAMQSPRNQFTAWRTYLDGAGLLEPSTQPQRRDDTLVEYVLGHEGREIRDGGLGLELVGHYAGQLALQISLGPLVPRQVVMSGRMASHAAIAEIRKNIVLWTNGYPKRHQFTAEGVKDHIVPSSAVSSSQSSEVRGAEILALSRATHGWEVSADNIPVQPRVIRFHPRK